jgi:catechol 2,3-dioxygenase-like lactoylglutathione lyase family enzyme
MRRIHHVGLTVTDLDQSIAFYRDVLGLELWVAPNEPVSGPLVAAALGVAAPASIRVALFSFGDGESLIELVQYLSPPSDTRRALTQNNIGASHIAFFVDDARAWMARLAEHGVETISSLNVLEDGALAGWRWVYFKDPDGHTLELVEVAYETSEQRLADVAAYLAAHRSHDH